MESSPIYTIGQGGRSLEEFIRLLQKNGIRFLIDVRTSPYSRFKPEFNREFFDRELKEHQIRYIYMGDTLGGKPSDPAMMIDGKFDYARMATTEAFRSGMSRLVKAYEVGVAVAVMCSEGKPEECHRSKLIGESLRGLDIPAIHIDENGINKSQQEIIDRITGGQLDLFGDSFTSRKKYNINTDKELQ